MKNIRIFPLFLACILFFFSIPTKVRAIEPIEIAAKAALLVDTASGEMLYEQNADEHLYPAALTSVMTALLVFEAVDDGVFQLEDTVTVTEAHLAQVPSGSSTAQIRVGEKLTISQLLSCILVVSAADASNILACEVSGTVDAFVDLMNRRAAELGCENTHFTNPHGIHHAKHYTSAWDLWRITQELLRHEALMEIVDQVSFQLPASEYSDARTFYTTNSLISQFRLTGYLYSRAQGIKAAQTSQAGYCLITCAVKGSTTLACIILGAERVQLADGSYQTQSFSEAKRLCEWGFSNFSRKTLLTGNEAIGTIPVRLSKSADQVVVHPAESVSAIVPNDLDVSTLSYRIEYSSESVDAPVTAGMPLGTLVLHDGEREYARVGLVAAADVEAAPALLFRQKVLDVLFSSLTKRVVLGVVLLVLLLLSLHLVRRMHRRSSLRMRNTYYRRKQYRGKRRPR